MTGGLAPALTGGEQTSLAGPSAPLWFAVYDDAGGSSAQFTARVNGTPSYPITTLPITGQSGNWGNIKPGMVVFVGSSAGGFDRGIYRIRWQNAATFPDIMIEEIGASDSGEINLATRNTSIQANDYVTVLYRFDLFGANPRIDYTGGFDATIYEDYDRGVYYENKYPQPFVNVYIDGRAGHYGTHVYSGTSKTFDIVFRFWSWWGATMTYSIILPSGWTLNSGSASGSIANGGTVTLNVTAPHSTNTYVIDIVANDPTGTGAQFEGYRKVWIKSNTYPPLSVVTWNRDDDCTGSRMTISLNSLTSAPAATMWHLFDMGSWNGSDVPTAIKSFTGWVVSRRENTEVGLASVELDLEGPMYVLDRIGGQSQIMTAVNATPASYQELYYGHSYIDFILRWILYYRAPGMLQLFNFNPSTLTDNGAVKYITDWRIDTGTILSQLQAQAKRFQGGNIGADPNGEIWVRRHVSRVPWSERGSIPIRATATAALYAHADLGYEQRPNVRRLRGEAFVSDGLSTNTPYWSDAPEVPGQGRSEEKLERMLVASASELYELTGNEYQARNNPYPDGTILIHKNWAVIYPAQMARLGLDIAATLRYDGVAYSGYALVKRVSYTHNPDDGTVDTSISHEAETVGVPGVDVPIPVPDQGNLNTYYQFTRFAPVPMLRSLNPNPAGTKNGAAVLPKDGSLGFAGTSSKAYVVSNILGTPRYRDITPTSGVL